MILCWKSDSPLLLQLKSRSSKSWQPPDDCRQRHHLHANDRLYRRGNLNPQKARILLQLAPDKNDEAGRKPENIRRVLNSESHHPTLLIFAKTAKAKVQKSIFRKIFRNDKKRPSTKSPKALKIRGGDEGIRTPDLLNANQALSQLSYAPTVRNAARSTPATNIILNYLAPVKRFAQKAQLINAARIRPVAKLSRAEKIPTAILPLPTSSSTLNGVNFSNT